MKEYLDLNNKEQNYYDISLKLPSSTLSNKQFNQVEKKLIFSSFVEKINS
jgi:hypothetical protein